MPHPLFEKHKATLDAAISAIHGRGYWTPYPEMPSPKVYGETAADDGKRAFEACLGADFVLDQPGQTGWAASERSPYGIDMAVRYPVCDPEALIAAAQGAMAGWRKLGADGRVGVCLEILDRLNKRSFEIAHAVMMTSGNIAMR